MHNIFNGLGGWQSHKKKGGPDIVELQVEQLYASCIWWMVRSGVDIYHVFLLDIALKWRTMYVIY